MQNRTVIILGSARSNGNTRSVTAYACQLISADIIDLKEYQIGKFDYEFANANDDFLPLMRRILSDYDRIILASPVYWYTVSATMKTFMDRFSDLLGPHKALGRQLRGKSLGLISCGPQNDCPPSYAEPIALSADYLGMDYLGHVHTWSGGGEIPDLAKTALKSWIENLP
ncbi:MAG TPA: NADPH-dependent oxidoreductase [Bacteroidetes bacterium]|nr:NADPH-dependent oxidoreductase [Bacteroidota bacterium]